MRLVGGDHQDGCFPVLRFVNDPVSMLFDRGTYHRPYAMIIIDNENFVRHQSSAYLSRLGRPSSRNLSIAIYLPDLTLRRVTSSHDNSSGNLHRLKEI
jgi:hypothetical protein